MARRAGCPPNASSAPPDATPLQPRDAGLVGRLLGDLPLSDRPFAELGAELGLGEDEVITRLHLLLGQGVLLRFGPVLRTGLAAPAGLSEFDRSLIEATRSGLPLVQRPYEALGAMLGTTSAAVREGLAGLRRRGLLCRIGAVIDAPAEDRPA